MNVKSKQKELERLQQQVRQLEKELRDEQAGESWQATGFYGSYYATTGFMLGIFGAVASLLVNVVAAPIAGKPPLELIRVFLTFPLGEQALQLSKGPANTYVMGDDVVIAFGCCLYLGTGMLLGVPFHVVLSRIAPEGRLVVRIVVALLLATVLWLFNFYAVLSWLQPLLFGGNWITDPTILPWWVAWATHLVFGWTMAMIQPWGRYRPYVRPTHSHQVA